MEREKNTVLPAHIFPKLSLSEDKWRAALAYLRAAALDRCVDNTLAVAVMAYNQFRFIENQKTGKNAANVFPKNTYEYELEDLCCEVLERKLRIELEYGKIEPKVKQTLESISELQHPFNAVSALKSLGI